MKEGLRRSTLQSPRVSSTTVKSSSLDVVTPRIIFLIPKASAISSISNDDVSSLYNSGISFILSKIASATIFSFLVGLTDNDFDSIEFSDFSTSNELG